MLALPALGGAPPIKASLERPDLHGKRRHQRPGSTPPICFRGVEEAIAVSLSVRMGMP